MQSEGKVNVEWLKDVIEISEDEIRQMMVDILLDNYKNREDEIDKIRGKLVDRVQESLQATLDDDDETPVDVDYYPPGEGEDGYVRVSLPILTGTSQADYDMRPKIRVPLADVFDSIDYTKKQKDAVVKEVEQLLEYVKALEPMSAEMEAYNEKRRTEMAYEELQTRREDLHGDAA